MERQPVSIRQLASILGVSHTEISRQMKQLAIKGQPQGKGKPTLLSLSEQDAIARALFVPASIPECEVEEISGGLSVYAPTPLATVGKDAGAIRQRQAHEIQASLSTFLGNRGAFRSAVLSQARENGAQLGHEAFLVQMNATMETYTQLQETVAGEMGVGKSDGPAAA